MRKRTRMIISTVVALVSVFAFSVNALAVEESFEITGGSLDFGIGNEAVFNSATDTASISLNSDIVFTGSKDNISVIDETGTNSGWTVSISAGDFLATGIDDPTDASGALMDVYVACGDWLSMTVDNSTDGIFEDGTNTLVPGTGGDGATVAAENVQFFNGTLGTGAPLYTQGGTNTLNLIEVEPGYGAGEYVFDINYTISLDSWLPAGARIVSSAPAGGRFEDLSIQSGDKLQVFAGIYKTEITYAASCNPAS